MQKKYSIMLCFIFFGLLSAVPAARADGGDSIYSEQKMGLRKLTPKEKAWLAKRVHPFKAPLPNKLALDRFAAAPGIRSGGVTLPSLAVNYQYLPPVSRQPLGSCAAWSSCYYVKTYQDAKERGWTDLATNPAHVMSPEFGYNLANNGVDEGSDPGVIMQLMCDHGCATMADMPNLSDYTSWPTASVWKSAITYRADTTSTIDLSTDAGINGLKQILANGDVAVIGIEVFYNLYREYPSSAGVTGSGISSNYVLYSSSITPLGGHALAVIGYDDNRTFNTDTGTGSGAFLIVNSWGAKWGINVSSANSNFNINTSSGFLWISYDCLKTLSGPDVPPPVEAYVMTDRTGYIPTTFGTFSLNHPARGDLDVQFMGGTSNLNPDWSFDCLPSLGGNLPVNQQIIVDLTTYDVDYTKPLWLGVYDSLSYLNSTGQVTYMSIINPSGKETASARVPQYTVGFSTVSIKMDPGGSDNISIKVYPNPFNPKKVSSGMTISNLAAGATIKIFNAAGELIRTLNNTTVNGVATWDGKNDGGSLVASGVYIMYVNAPARSSIVKAAVEK